MINYGQAKALLKTCNATMPRFYPNILLSDCWASIGDITFYHRNGKCFFRKKASPVFQGTSGQLDQSSLHHRALEAWRGLEPETQKIWNEYARTVPSQRMPYDPKTSISGYNLFVSAYHGFAQLGNEHVPVPQRKEKFPVFHLEFVSATAVESVNLLMKFRSTFSQETDFGRYRFLLKLQLEQPGRGRNQGMLRNFFSLPGDSGDRADVCFLIKNFRSVWGLSLDEYQAHCRYLLLDSQTGYRSRFIEKSFSFSYGYL